MPQLSGLYYPFLSVKGDHHAASHDDLSEGYERIRRFRLWFLSNVWAGWKHDNMKLPVVTAGGLGGTLKTGRSLNYLYAGDDNRRICGLYLSIMDRFGVKLPRSETRLADL